MWMLKGLCVLWVLCGLGLLGYGLWGSFRSYLITSSTDMISVEGTVVDEYVKVTEGTESGRRKVYAGFPHPVVEWTDKTGSTHKATDPNGVPFFLYNIGQKVPLKIFEGPSQAHVDDLYTRFCLPAAFIILGIVFIILPILGWRMLNAAGASGTDIVEGINATVNKTPLNPVFQAFPVNIKYFIWAFFALVAFAAFMAARPFLKDFFPGAADDNAPSLAKEKDSAAQREKDAGERSSVRHETGGGPGKIIDERTKDAVKVLGMPDHVKRKEPAADPDNIVDESTKETALMRALKEKDDKTINEMMGRKLDVNVKDIHGRTPLFYAVRARRAEAVRRLISIGADLEASSADLLIAAIDVGDGAIADILLDAGKDANKLDKIYRKYPLDLAIYNEMPALAVRLAKNRAKHTAPVEFIEAPRDPDRYSGQTIPNTGFSGISLDRWIGMVRAKREVQP